MRLPAPALACGCASCAERLNKEFASIIRRTYGVDELYNLMLLAVKLEEQPPVSPTLAERIHPYTRRGTEF
jgi:hypothetical protein